MRRLFLLLVIIVLALFAAAMAPVFKTDPGLVQIHFLGWTLETTVLVLLLAVLLVWLAVSLALKIWRAPVETARRVRERRSMLQLEKGLLALTEGDWSRAEKALQRSASSEGRTTARYLAAAQAADGQDAEDRAEYYLEQADSKNSRGRFLVALTRARMMVANGRHADAVAVLETLHKRRRRHPQVLELLSESYRATGQWAELQILLPAMLKAGVVDEISALKMRQDTSVSELQKCDDLASLKATWQRLPKAMKQTVEVIRVFAEQAVKLGGAELNEQVLRNSIRKEWNPALLIPYGDPGAEDTSKRLKHCEKWLNTHPNDPALHLAMGRLCASEKLWGKARTHLVKSLEIEPSVGGYDSLGQLLERKGEVEASLVCFRNALRLSQGKTPEPLPQERVKLALTEEDPE
jgi:HemY protein